MQTDSLPHGVVSLLRQMHAAGGALPSASLRDASRTACMAALHEVYGMVQPCDDGWRLAVLPEWLDAPSLPPLPLPAEVVDEVASTQALIRPRAAPCALLTEHQTAGMGQHGRGWLGLPGDSIAVSVKLAAPAQPGGLSVALGAMLCAALSDALRFKWPNDIVTTAGEKVAGILTQVVGDAVIIGVGVNWQMTDALRRQVMATGNTPAGVAAHAPKVTSRRACAAVVVQTVVQTVDAYQDGFPPFRTIAEAKHILAAGEVLPGGGCYLGFADDGALQSSKEEHYVVGG